jgi:hypothetical protein
VFFVGAQPAVSVFWGCTLAKELDMVDVDSRLRDRFALLKVIYDEAEGHLGRYVSAIDAGKQLEFSDQYAKDLVAHLCESGLVESMTVIYSVCLSARGINEIERALSRPTERTDFFEPRHFVINYGTMQTQFVQGTQSNAVQTAISDDVRPKTFWKKYGEKIVIGVIIALVGAFLIYKFGWNK